MGTKLLEFNSTGQDEFGQNITRAIDTDNDVVFNETYIVIGSRMRAGKIYATYDLTVHGDLFAKEILVNGSLLVTGNIEADKINCRGELICTGDIRTKEISIDGFTYANSATGDTAVFGNDLFIHTTVDTNKSLCVSGLVVASEGIMGAGELDAHAAIANEYFEFSGEHKGDVFEIARMDFSRGLDSTCTDIADQSTIHDLSDAIDIYSTLFNENIKEWYDLDEDDFINQFFKIEHATPKLQTITRLIDRIVEISYTNRITNLRDYLFAVWAQEEFPDGILSYYTIQGVFDDLLKKARAQVRSLEFHPDSIRDIADSLYVISKYSDELDMPFEEFADRIFSSIGLRYTTVKHILEVQ